jgi:hypothetical protein
MSLKQFISLTILLFSITYTAQAQSEPSLTKTLYTYSFTGLLETTDVSIVVKSVEDLKGVTSCKSVLKPERQSGQLIVIVEEYSRTSEGQEMFDITDLKKIIIENGLLPNELIIKSLQK